MTTVQTSDAVIAGGGIIGLSCALELASRGLSVTVLERGEAMREASWAAAGMLAARDPENPPQLRALAELSLALYPEFLVRVEQLSGVRVPLRTRVALQGVHGTGLDMAALHGYVPDLLTHGYSFLQLDEPSLDPRDLCHALPLAARAAGVRLYERSEVVSVEQAGPQVRVATHEGEFYAKHYVHCIGAWAGDSRHKRGAFALPVEPRKGQIVEVTLPSGAPTLKCVVRTPETYLVPRGEGRVVVGASVETAGFDRTVHGSVTKALLSAAALLWPPIRLGTVTEEWTGLRPSTPDGLPVMGTLAGAGQWVATGHFRNGILLAPGTARVLGRLLLAEEPEVTLDEFRAARFAPVASLS